MNKKKPKHENLVVRHPKKPTKQRKALILPKLVEYHSLCEIYLIKYDVIIINTALVLFMRDFTLRRTDNNTETIP